MKSIICTIILFLFTLQISGQTKSLAKVVLNTSWYPQAQFAGYFVAHKKGFYEEKGINLKFKYSTYDERVNENLVNGTADLGIMWLHDGIMAHNKTGNLVNIAQFMDSSNIIVVSRSKDIESVGIWKPFVPFLGEVIHKSISDTIEIVPLREGIEAFISGAVDAITVMSYNEYQRLIYGGFDADELVIHSIADMGLLMPEDGIYCLSEYQNDNPEVIRGFIEASRQGWEYAFNNIDDAVDICFEYMNSANHKSNITIQKAMLSEISKSVDNSEGVDSSWKLSRKMFDNTVKLLRQYNLVDSQIQYDNYFRGNQ